MDMAFLLCLYMSQNELRTGTHKNTQCMVFTETCRKKILHHPNLFE